MLFFKKEAAKAKMRIRICKQCRLLVELLVSSILGCYSSMYVELGGHGNMHW